MNPNIKIKNERKIERKTIGERKKNETVLRPNSSLCQVAVMPKVRHYCKYNAYTSLSITHFAAKTVVHLIYRFVSNT